MPRRLVLALAVLAVTGCSAEVKGPKVQVTPPKVVVGPSGGHGDFCPPGQAKKGNC
jgi:hypothetical protein